MENCRYLYCRTNPLDKQKDIEALKILSLISKKKKDSINIFCLYKYFGEPYNRTVSTYVEILWIQNKERQCSCGFFAVCFHPRDNSIQLFVHILLHFQQGFVCFLFNVPIDTLVKRKARFKMKLVTATIDLLQQKTTNQRIYRFLRSQFV